MRAGSLFAAFAPRLPTTTLRSPRARFAMALGSTMRFLHILMLISCGLSAVSAAIFGWGDSQLTIQGPTAVEIAEGSGVRFVHVATSGYHSVAVSDTGSVYGWGHNNRGQVDPSGVINETSYYRASLGEYGIVSVSKTGAGAVMAVAPVGYTLVLTADGNVIGYGGSAFGQLGVVTATAPVTQIVLPMEAKKIAAGQFNAAAILVDGSLFVWGSSDSHPFTPPLLGIPPQGIVTPMQYGAAGDTFIDVTISAPNLVAVRSDGKIVATGDPHPLCSSGAAATTATVLSYYPFSSLRFNSVKSSSTSTSMTYITANGQPMVCGIPGFYSNLPVPNPETANEGPHYLSGTWVDIATATTWGIGITRLSDQSYLIVTWGDNEYGITGGLTPTIAHGPEVVATPTILEGKAIVQVSADGWSALLRDSTGRIYGWSVYGDDVTTALRPVVGAGIPPRHRARPVGLGLTDVVNLTPRILDSYLFTVFVANDNDVYVFGNFNSTHLKMPTRFNYDDPPVSAIEELSVGLHHALLLTAKGSVYALGYIEENEIGFPDQGKAGIAEFKYQTISAVMTAQTAGLAGDVITHIAANEYSSIVSTDTGALYQFGHVNPNVTSMAPVAVDMTNIPTGTQWTKLVPGFRCFFAISETGRAWGWGSAKEGQLFGVYPDLRPVQIWNDWISTPYELLSNHAINPTLTDCLANKLIKDIASAGERVPDYAFTIVLTEDGDVCIVGGNEKAMGIGEQYPVLSWTRPVLERNINSDLPRKVSEIGAGYLSSYARFATGEYMFWGNNLHQQLHINPSGTEIYEPFPMVIEDTALDGRKINKIIMGYNDAFALVKPPSLSIPSFNGVPKSSTYVIVKGEGFAQSQSLLKASIVLDSNSYECSIFSFQRNQFGCQFSDQLMAALRTSSEFQQIQVRVVDLETTESILINWATVVTPPNIQPAPLKRIPLNAELIEISGTDLGHFFVDSQEDLSVVIGQEPDLSDKDSFGCFVVGSNNNKLLCQPFGPLVALKNLYATVLRNGGGPFVNAPAHIGRCQPSAFVAETDIDVPWTAKTLRLMGVSFVASADDPSLETTASIVTYNPTTNVPSSQYDTVGFKSTVSEVFLNTSSAEFEYFFSPELIGHQVRVKLMQNHGKANSGSEIVIGRVAKAPTLLGSVYENLASNAAYVSIEGIDIPTSAADVAGHIRFCGAAPIPVKGVDFEQETDEPQRVRLQLLDPATPIDQPYPNPSHAIGCVIDLDISIRGAVMPTLRVGTVSAPPFVDKARFPLTLATNAESVEISGENLGASVKTTSITSGQATIVVQSVGPNKVVFSITSVTEEGKKRAGATQVNATLVANGGATQTFHLATLVSPPTVNAVENPPSVTSGHISFALSGSLFAPSPADLEVHYRVVPEGTIADALPTYTATIVSHTDTSITFEANPEYTFVNSPSSFQAAVRSYQGYSNWETVAEVEPANSTGAIAGGVVGGLVAVVIIALVIVFLVLRRHRGDIKGSHLEVPEDMAHIFNIKSTDLEIISKLGEGSFGAVYLGKFRKRFVAIKKLAGSMLSSLVNDFFREASLMLSIPPHRNIVRIFGLCQELNNFSLVMEFLPEGALDSYLARGSEIPAKEMYRIVRGIARGMEHLAAQNIVHRDLAARNILLDANHEPRVSDFGFSRVVGDEKAGVTNTTIGPIKWMPWESIANREYSEKSDVWAYGCTLYEIVKREEPYQDQNLMDVAVRIRDEGLTPMKSLPPDAPEYIVALMELCFSHNPNDRPTFKQIGEWLEEHAPAKDRAGADAYAVDTNLPIANDPFDDDEPIKTKKSKKWHSKKPTAQDEVSVEMTEGGTKYTGM